MIIKNNLLNILYPQVCGICGKIAENGLCRKCQKMLEEFNICNKIGFNDKNFSNLIYLFPYQGVIRNMLINYKFNEKPYIYTTFINFILNNKELFEFLKKYDKIIPVPVSKKRLRERGYNQSYIIAKELAKNLKIECDKNLLYKIKDNKEQSKLDKKEREINILGAYNINSKIKLYNKNILLIDDIYTTGNTVNECCKILKKANPQIIDVFVLAKD